MARNLYRFYLYTVFIAMLIFAAVVGGQLLQALLSLTPLRNQYDTVSGQAQVVQSIVLALVSWVIAGGLGGLHYWLIRRDMQDDLDAGGSGIRSFFLNITEAISIAIAVPVVGFSVLSNIGYNSLLGITSSLAVAIPALAFAIVIELERRRTQAKPGAATAFQRLHLYGVQLLLLIFLSFSWLSSIRPLVDGLVFGGRGTLESCGGGSCSRLNLPVLTMSVLWFVLFWVGYGWLIRNDKSPLLRLILHFASLAYGVGFLLAGIYYGFVLLISPLFKVTLSLKDILGSGAQYDFISPLTLGMLVVAVYHLWLAAAVKRGLIEQGIMITAEYAIAAVLAGGTFWWGCGYVLFNAMQTLAPSPAAPDVQSWVSAIALVIAGVSYIPLDLYQRRRMAMNAASAAGARRGFVLALLGGGILSFAIGGAIALYAWGTSLFGSPITDWSRVSHQGLAGFVIGAIIVAIYLWTAIHERLFSGFTKRAALVVASTAAPQTPVQTKTLEEILDDLLAGKIMRDEAVKRIRALEHTTINVSG